MRVVYIDSLFLINLIVNYLLLLATVKIGALQCRKPRLILSAVFGALYAVLTVLPGFEFSQNVLIKLACGLLMLLCAFGGLKGLVRIFLIFIAVSAAFGGITMLIGMLGGEIWAGSGIYVPVSFRSLALSFGFAYGLLTLVFKYMAARRGDGGFIKLVIKRGGRSVELLALKDTGNALRDPVSGVPVPVAGLESLSPLFEQAEIEILSKTKDKTAPERLEALWKYNSSLRFRLIPYSTVSVKNEMLLAFKANTVCYNDREISGIWVALAPESISEGGVYSALICADI